MGAIHVKDGYVPVQFDFTISKRFCHFIICGQYDKIAPDGTVYLHMEAQLWTK
jgi:hypothetical protein